MPVIDGLFILVPADVCQRQNRGLDVNNMLLYPV